MWYNELYMTAPEPVDLSVFFVFTGGNLYVYRQKTYRKKWKDKVTHMKKLRRSWGMLCVFAMTVIFALTGCDMVDELRSETGTVDYNEVYGLADGEYAIMLNHEMQDARGIGQDGQVYMDLNMVARVNSRLYWDDNENLVLYATPDGMMEMTPDSSQYLLDGRSMSSDYPIIIQKDGLLYVAGEFLSQNTKMDYNVYTDPNRIVIQTEWNEVQMTTVTDKTPIRYRGGIKSEMFRELEKGETLIVLDDGSGDEWANVVSEDGYNGWVLNEDIETPYAGTETEPEYAEPVFDSISKPYTINMAWHGIYSTAANEELSSIIGDLDGVNTLSPRWFYFENTDGDLVTLGSADYVNTAHAAGMEVWAMFSNEFDNFDSAQTDEVLTHTSKRRHVLDQIGQFIDAYGLDGINLDFELISEEGADSYIQFVRELSMLCHEKGVVLSVDNYVPTYTLHYNHREEGVFADYVVIMGYDEHYGGSEESGSVGSMGFVRQGIEDMTAMVPAEKVINGIPLYTRVWSTDANGAVLSFSCGMEEAKGYLDGHGVTPTYDAQTGQNYGSYTSEIDGNFYEIWLEDETSITARAQMIKEYGLAGIAAWRIGYEDSPNIWTIIKNNIQ